MHLWGKLQGSGLLEEFGREDIETTSSQPAPPREQLDAIFADASQRLPQVDDAAPSQQREVAEKQAEWHRLINGVKDKHRFTGFTPKSEQELHAEVALLRDLYTRGAWHEVDNAWKAALLPVGALVRRKIDQYCFFVQKGYAAAALTWPARQVEVNLWEPDLSVTSLQWICCFDLDAFEVIATEYLSPTHLMLEATTRAACGAQPALTKGCPVSFLRQ